MEDDFSFDPYAASYQSKPAARNIEPVVNAPPLNAPIEAAAHNPANVPAAAFPQEVAINDMWAERNRREQERQAQIAADEAVAKALEEVEMGPVRPAPGAPIGFAQPAPAVEFENHNRLGEIANLAELARNRRNVVVRGERCCNYDVDDCLNCLCCGCECCGCEGFYCYESITYIIKAILQTLALSLAIVLMVKIATNPRPLEDISDTWRYPPLNDIIALPADALDVYCPSGYEPYRSIGYDTYVTGTRKYRTYHTDYFYTWKTMRFCTSYGDFSAIQDRPVAVDGVCPNDTYGNPMIMCSGLCFEGTTCPIASVSFTRSETLPPSAKIGDGYTWFHRDSYYTLSSTRLAPDTTSGPTPLLGFSAAVTLANPPVKCFGEEEAGHFRHDKKCDKPDPQYTLFDVYDYEMTNNARLFYRENDSNAHSYYNEVLISRDNVGFLQRPEQSFFETCPMTRSEVMGLRYYTTVIFRVCIALVTMIGLEFLIYIIIFPFALCSNCDNEDNCCPRFLNASQISNFSGFVLSLVIVIYSLLLRNGVSELINGVPCFDETYQALLAEYLESMNVVVWMILVVFVSKAAMTFYDFFYCCLWPPE